jgi:hypothetical protein
MSRKGLLAVVAMLGVLVALTPTAWAGSGGGSLGIAAPIQELHIEGWETVVPVVIGLIGAIMILAGLILHHGGLFMAIASVLVVIGAIGVGIPAVMGQSGLAFGATLDEVAPLAQQAAPIVGGLMP